MDGQPTWINDEEHRSMETPNMEVDRVQSLENELLLDLRRGEQGNYMMEAEDRRRINKDEEERGQKSAFSKEQLRREHLDAEHRKEDEIRLEEERKRLLMEEENWLLMQRQKLLMEEQLNLLREEQQKRLREEQQKRLREEQQKRLREEQKLREEAETKEKERQLAEEEEEAKRRLNVTSCADLHNRHLDNVSFNVSSSSYVAVRTGKKYS